MDVSSWIARQQEKQRDPAGVMPRSGNYTSSDPTGRGFTAGQAGARQLPDPRAPVQGRFLPGRASPTQEFVAASTVTPYLAGVLRILPHSIDDLTRDFGDDLYERMLLDYQVSASVRTLIFQVIAEELQFHPAIDDRKDPEYRLAKEIRDFIERDVGNFGLNSGRLLHGWMQEKLRALPLGNRVAERVLELCEEGKDAGRLCLKSMKVKPRRNIGFVVDQYSNTVGIRAVIPGVMPYVLPQTTVLDPASLPNVIPRAKFTVLTWDMQDNDPRGVSILRPAYEAWFEKRQAAQPYLQAMAQFGGPMVLGFTPEGAQPHTPTDDLGNPTGPAVEPTEAMLQALIRFKSGGAAAFPHGSQVQTFFTSGAAEAFVKAMDRWDLKIAAAIRLTTRDTHEAEHGSRADSQTAQDVASNLIKACRRWLAHMIYTDVVYPSVVANWGKPIARRLCPKVALSSTEHQDFSATVSAITQLKNAQMLMPSQMQWAFEKLGMPPPEPAEMAQLQQQAQQQAQGGAPGGGLAGMLGGAGGGEVPPPGGDGTLAGALPDLFGQSGEEEQAVDNPDGTIASALPGLFGGGA